MSDLRASDIFGADGGGDDDHHDASDKKGESQSTKLVRLTLDAGAALWHTPASDGYITIPIKGHREHHALQSRGCRDYLTRLLYLETSKAPNASALQDAIGTLSGMARFDGPTHDVAVRVAGDGGDGATRLYLDLCDNTWQVVEISADGWRLTSVPAVRFRRPRGVLPLPAPADGGSLTLLREFVNVGSDDDFVLLVSWLIAALLPTGPYPVLVLLGEQGTAKTTTSRALRRLIDPSASDVRAEPREPRDLMVAANSGHVVALDNISRLPDWLSDALCRLSTGGGFSTRALYTDAEEVIFDATRPVILTGITSIVARGDLLDRAIVLTLPVIEDRDRRPEAEHWRVFEAARPRILGALLDAASTALRHQHTVRLDHLPRMADFAVWVAAAEPACPWSKGQFIAAYAANRHGAIEVTLDGDVLADVVRAIAPWEGTAKDLLEELNRRAADSVKHRKEWFSRPRQVADALRRMAPALRRVGVNVQFRRQADTGRRLIDLSPVGTGADASRSSRSSRTPDSQAENRDDAADAVRHGGHGLRHGAADRDESRDDTRDDASRKTPNVSGHRDARDARDAPEPLLSDVDQEVPNDGGF